MKFAALIISQVHLTTSVILLFGYFHDKVSIYGVVGSILLLFGIMWLVLAVKAR